MKRTKNARLLACFDSYQKMVGGRPCTADEVAAWILDRCLWPVPTIRDPIVIQQVWEEMFFRATTEIEVELRVATP